MSNPLHPELLHPCPGARAAAGLEGAGAALVRGFLMMVLVVGSAYGGPATARESSAPRSKLHFVVPADDTSYLVLANVEKAEELLPHGPLRLTGDESNPRVIAEVSEAHLPADLRAWSKRKVFVDERCHATVSGFAIVARLVGDVGDPSYSLGDNGSKSPADSVFSLGHKVLAARLDRCKGSFARAASAEPIQVLQPAVNKEAVAAARADFLKSKVVAKARKEWVGADAEGAREQVNAPRVVTVRHPTTGETWISLHLRFGDGPCEDPPDDVWGLYRVTEQGVERTRLLRLGQFQSIDALLDVEGDGQLELLLQGDFGTTRELRSGEGKVIRRITMPISVCMC
ncbi:hypothetical protein [Archangium lansingense]|uniref:Lipoprotein n=1 Tax=Archangium lansingense TaxID=2995310 RepID=A0ABT4ANE5_9BACT|nr:hypothetical protein [Archangium lansinium]MCY1082699.1 hypothetical protein [Archangium lansinium]